MAKAHKEDTASTTTRIKQAAHELFLEKGFASTTIRDIAEKAGTNVALLNYHFGSKKQLLEVVMLEKVQQLLSKLIPIISDGQTSLETKIEGIASAYIDFLLANPDLLTFVLNELRISKFEFLSRAGVPDVLFRSHFGKQLREAAGDLNPIQLLMSIASMIVVPFIAKPILTQTGMIDTADFRKMMLERKKLVPIWAKSILTTNS